MVDKILEQYEVRKSNKEKTIFIDYLKDRLSQCGYDKENDIKIEEKWKGILKTRNIVVGNPEEAEIFITAHYDTCAVIPFPNLLSPTNPVIFWGFQFFLVFIILFLGVLVAVPVMLLTENALITYYAFLATLILLMFQLMIGYRNKHTANDNTSGIITITRILEALSPEDRKKICAVYFDNEEKGLFGSSFFAGKHKNVRKNKLLINFDCVGDGENIVFMAKGKARSDKNYSLLVETLKSGAVNFDGNCLCKKMKPIMFPSDQANFEKGIGVCALKKSPIGMYAARIHTPFDTKCREENIEFLSECMVEFMKAL